MTKPKQTPLYDIHVSRGGKMVEFAGFLMPVSYGSIVAEHHAVRDHVGVFDVSHMGEFLITGRGAKDFVNEVITNDCSRLSPGGLQYTVMCREDGTVIDDLLVFLMAEDRLLLVVNAANIDKDYDHITSFQKKDVHVRNVSDEYALVAVQGPRARELLVACAFFAGCTDRLHQTRYYEGFAFDHGGAEVLVSRTGYTGELGFEVFLPAALAEKLWREIDEVGADFGLTAIGLGARDTLRFEASYCLYGHELDDDTSPLEVGLGWVVKLKKRDFCGLAALRREKEQGPRRMLVGLELQGRSIARRGYAVRSRGREVGRVTSGTFAPTLQKSLCMALIDVGHGGDGGFEVQIRESNVPASLTPLPFYKSRAK